MSDIPASPSTAGFARIAAFAAAERATLLRFLVVGTANTAVAYGLFCLALAIMPTTFIALCASTVLAILFSFVSNGALVFGSRDPRRILRFYAVYAVVFVYNAVGLLALEGLGVPPGLGGLILLPAAVIASYVLNKHFVFRRPR